MKKVLLVLALVAVYGFAISNVSAKVISAEKAQVTVVAEADDNITPVVEEKKDKKKDKKKAATTGCSETQKKSCAASGKTCGTAEKKTEAKKTEAKKSSCCGGK